MSKERRRSIGTAQASLRELNFVIDGTSGTPAASGLDKMLISSVVDNGVGSYTINFLKPFNIKQAEGPHPQITCITPQRVPAVVAVAYNSITIDVTDLAGAAADADIIVKVTGSDHRFVQK